MKSHSVQRAHRVPGAELHAVVDVLARGEAVLVHPHRRHQVRDEQHVHDEARAVLRADRALADLLDERLARLATVSSAVSSATTISTSFITGTGEKKCSPSTRSGRCVARRRAAAIGIDEVFDARITESSERRRRGAGTPRLLDVEVLDDRLDRRAREPCSECSSVENAIRSCSASRLRRVVQLAAAHARARPTASMRPFERSQRRLARARRRGRDAGARRRLGDPEPMKPGADDADLPHVRHGAGGYCFAASISRSRSSIRRILPVSVFGRSSTNSILRG